MDKTSMSDAELLHLVRSGDPSGLSFVYEKYRKEYFNWIRRFSRCDADDACEYYQGTIVIFYENVTNGKLTELQSSLKTYLFGIGKNLVMHEYRKSQRGEKVKAEFIIQSHLADSAQEMLSEENDLALVHRCFERIGDPCHRLLQLFYFNQKSMEEISGELGYKNPETAKNQKYKCMERLRKLVEGERPTNHAVMTAE
ncbi:MAG TPA: sigma-70 family RNA polymerase sigma factor [Cyclobacteriaceae bacterium]|nr:sigma-70 family RNA polymerase sigma factor [Cyclobacteriaceae bacterium]